MNAMNGLKNMYLICGDEDYLREQEKNRLLKALGCEGSMNYNCFSEEDIDLDEIISLMHTLPFAEEHRTIMIDGCGWFKGEGSKETAEAFSELPDSTVVIFYEKNVDKNNVLTRLIQSKGKIIRFDTADSRQGKDKTLGKSEVRDWVKNELKHAGRRIDSRTLNELTELTGYDMQNLSTELEKLICYTLDKPANYVIGRQDIDEVCSKTITDRIFDMIAFKLKGRVSEALTILEELFAVKTAAMRIIYVMVKQYEKALAVKEGMTAGLSDAEIMAKTGIKDWQLRRIKDQVTDVTLKELIKRLEACADTECSIKSGDISDRLGVELLIIK